ncbi:iron ABC transporter permease [Salinibacterium sp. NK8237]|uniref:FecCD family ABC transporter permease n=1 Tax=Salinibacterium sp. NK8237 TaxID=2792038 RepID=UPI0018CD9706|nr:iron chelate uptake ABC transporter family permease subunit [Salinibacterium sp. NK8237]MBH0130115.1 iron chelate uptake ABC transporter family permease subunit [Salinibacterium sp. NK8237]
MTQTASASRARLSLRTQRWITLGSALGLLAVVLVLSLALGARGVEFSQIWQALFDPEAGNNDQLVIRELRLPRTIVGLLAGLSLGVAGAVMQGVTRNPLADPGLLGVNAGASLAVVFAISVLSITNPTGYIWFAFAGAAAAASIVYAIGSLGREGATPVKLVLAGTAVTAGITSVISLVLISDTDTLNTFRFWSVGSLASRDLEAVRLTIGFVVAGAIFAIISGRMLNLVALGDDLARGLGQRVYVARAVAAGAVVLLCGSATALAGPIVFVGLVVPHIVRPFTGPDYRWIIAVSALVGPSLLLIADIVGRLVVAPSELEAGLVVAIIGAPVMIALVRRVKLAGL